MWQQLKIHLKSENASALEQTLTAHGAISISYLDAEDQPIFQLDPGSTRLWDTTFMFCLFDKSIELDTLLTELKNAPETLNNENLKIEVIEDQDWENNWKADFRPMRFGKKLWIYPSWQIPPEPQGTNIKLDPGLAFGSGSHTTTALCLHWLDKMQINDKVVIDYGCGSGILGIAAAALGASKVHSIDNDPQAIAATINNSHRNNTTNGVLTTYLPENFPKLQADILIANILAEPLMELSIKFAELLKPNGLMALSGILEEQIPAIISCYKHWFDMDAPLIEDDWALLTGTRKA